MRIPVRNFYRLYLYAWCGRDDEIDEEIVAAVGAEESVDFFDFFALVLVKGVERLLKQGLDRGYATIEERTSRLAGRINFGESVRRAYVGTPSLHCAFDVLSYDVPHNQILKATILQLAHADGLTNALKDELLGIFRHFNPVADVVVSPQLFRQVQLGAHNLSYEHLLGVCRFVYEGLFVGPVGGDRKFFSVPNDEKLMARLFERFVRNFYRHKLRGQFRMPSRAIRWRDVSGPASATDLVPMMLTDIMLESDTRTVIIDTKYTPHMLAARPGGAEMYRSTHLYQIFSYLANYRQKQPRSVEGVLLYPSIEAPVVHRFSLGGFELTIASLDLAQDWIGVKSDLLSLVGCEPAQFAKAEATSPLPIEVQKASGGPIRVNSDQCAP